MDYQYTIRREAFLKAISQFDLSTLPEELQIELDAVRQALYGEVNEDTIQLLNSVVKKSDTLKQIYDQERQALKAQDNEVERSKGIPPREDNPKTQDLAPTNFNPPTPKSENTNSQDNQQHQPNNK
ncbi:hypothetical protein H6G27_14990 [Nostoc linckia FACHB-104]|nr:hypothetical protein [Nostoc linckia FACHB-104]